MTDWKPLTLPFHRKSVPLIRSDDPTVQHLDQFLNFTAIQIMIFAGQNEIQPLSLHHSRLIQAHACNISSDTTNCHVLVPPTGEEDTTQALTTQAKSPMNM